MLNWYVGLGLLLQVTPLDIAIYVIWVIATFLHCETCAKSFLDFPTPIVTIF